MDGKLDALGRQVNDLNESIKALTRTVNLMESSVDGKIEDLKQTLDRKINEAFEAKRDVLKFELKEELQGEISALKDELYAAKMELSETKTELSRVKAISEAPFNPNQSVVIFGLRSNEEEDVQDTVGCLFSTILQWNWCR